MIDKRKVLAVIPARGGSKGIPHKNIVDLCGKPLIAYTIEAAAACKYIDRCVVSTDDEEIAVVARQYGGDVPFLRPDYLSSDTAKSIDALLHAVEFCEEKDGSYDIVILLQPTSPLRTGEDIDRALEMFAEKGCDSLAAASAVEEHPLLIRERTADGRLLSLTGCNATVRRQDMKEYYFVNGAIYINARTTLNRAASLNDNEYGYVISQSHAVDIDTIEDLEYVRWLKGEKLK